MLSSTARTVSSPSKRLMERPFLDQEVCRPPRGDIASQRSGVKTTAVRERGRPARPDEKLRSTWHKSLVLADSSPYNRDQCFFASRMEKHPSSPYTREGPER